MLTIHNCESSLPPWLLHHFTPPTYFWKVVALRRWRWSPEFDELRCLEQGRRLYLPHHSYVICPHFTVFSVFYFPRVLLLRRNFLKCQARNNVCCEGYQRTLLGKGFDIFFHTKVLILLRIGHHHGLLFLEKNLLRALLRKTFLGTLTCFSRSLILWHFQEKITFFHLMETKFIQDNSPWAYIRDTTEFCTN